MRVGWLASGPGLCLLFPVAFLSSLCKMNYSLATLAGDPRTPFSLFVILLLSPDRGLLEDSFGSTAHSTRLRTDSTSMILHEMTNESESLES